MTRSRLAVGVLAHMVLCGVAEAQAVGSCPGGRGITGDLGIAALRCVGPAAVCTINVEEAGSLRHSFSVEPIVSRADPPATGAGVEVGDILVAIDERLITTREGGRYLANLVPEQEVELVLRRDGRMIRVTVVAREGCGVTSLSVRPR
jgi:hypothetical protein